MTMPPPPPLPMPPMPPPETMAFGPVVIGAREIYDAVVRVSAKLDTLHYQVAAIEQVGNDHEKRLRSLERSRWPLPSLALAVAAGTLVVTVLVK